MSAVEERTAEKRRLDKDEENEVATKEPRLDNGKEAAEVLTLHLDILF